jgi:hypothetical protein
MVETESQVVKVTTWKPIRKLRKDDFKNETVSFLAQAKQKLFLI